MTKVPDGATIMAKEQEGESWWTYYRQDYNPPHPEYGRWAFWKVGDWKGDKPIPVTFGEIDQVVHAAVVLVVHVAVFGAPPRGWPQRHDLYFYDRNTGWYYLTQKGQEYRKSHPEAAIIEARYRGELEANMGKIATQIIMQTEEA